MSFPNCNIKGWTIFCIVPKRLGSFTSAAISMAVVVSGLVPVSHAAATVRGWNLLADSSVATGYDSNINLAETAQGDLFVDLEQNGSARRDDGTLFMQVEGGIAARTFLDESSANSVDGGISFSAKYPNGFDGTVSGWNASALWRSDTLVRPDEERRLRQRRYAAAFDRTWMLSPKSGLSGAIAIEGTGYSDAGYRSSEGTALEIGWAHERSPLLRIDTAYRLALERSRGRESQTDIRMVSHTVGLRARGELLPKLTGSLFAGISSAQFSGGLAKDDFGPAIDADLTWTASPHLIAKILAQHDVTFSPEGEATRRTRLSARVSQSIRPGLTVVARLSPEWADYTGSARVRSATLWNWGMALEYQRTNRFRAELAADWQDNQSNIRIYNYRQLALHLQTTWHY